MILEPCPKHAITRNQSFAVVGKHYRTLSDWRDGFTFTAALATTSCSFLPCHLPTLKDCCFVQWVRRVVPCQELAQIGRPEIECQSQSAFV
jgi:hypothetical protein